MSTGPSSQALITVPEVTEEDILGFLDELDRLDDAGQLATNTLEHVYQLLEKLERIQAIDEQHCEWDTSEEALEKAWDEVYTLVHQCDLIARKPLRNKQSLEGGVIDCGGHLRLEMPNLRIRGSDSLALVKEVNDVVIYVGAGGPVASATIPSILTDAAIDAAPEDDIDLSSDLLSSDVKTPSIAPTVTLGTYRVELHYIANGTKAHVFLYTERGQKPIEECLGVSLKRGNDQHFIFFDNGLTLLLTDYDPPEMDGQEAFSTVQLIEMRHESGEFLATMDNILSAKSRPRDFASHAAFVENAIDKVTSFQLEIEAFRKKISESYDEIFESLTPESVEHEAVVEPFSPHQLQNWDFIYKGALLDALGDSTAKPRTPEWHYLKQLHQTASPGYFLSRTLERALWDIMDSKPDRFLDRMNKLRRSLNYDSPHTATSVSLLLHIIQSTHAVATGDTETCHESISSVVASLRPHTSDKRMRPASMSEEHRL